MLCRPISRRDHIHPVTRPPTSTEEEWEGGFRNYANFIIGKIMGPGRGFYVPTTGY